MRIPLAGDPVLVNPDGTIEVLSPEVGTREAAQLLGCAVRTVQAMCDEGRLVEGLEWRKLRARGGRGQYRIKTSALLRRRH